MQTTPSGIRIRVRGTRINLAPISRLLRDALASAWHIQVHHGGLLTHVPKDITRPLVEVGYLLEIGKRRYRVSTLGEHYLRETGGVRCDPECRAALRNL